MDFYKVTFSFPWTKQILFDESETDGIKISEQCNDIISRAMHSLTGEELHSIPFPEWCMPILSDIIIRQFQCLLSGKSYVVPFPKIML